MGNIANASIPETRRATSPIHGSVDNPFESLISPLKWVLVLILWFASPNLNPEHSEIIKDLMPIVTGNTITYDAFGGSPGL